MKTAPDALERRHVRMCSWAGESWPGSVWGALPPVMSVCWRARHLGWHGAWLLRDRDAHGQHPLVISGVHVLGVHGLTED